MNFAIIQLGGHQIWVETDQYFIVTKISSIPGTIISINKILLISRYNTFIIGKPFLPIQYNHKLKATIIEHLRGVKITVYKMKSKKKYRRKKGHRQEMTKLIINNIEF